MSKEGHAALETCGNVLYRIYTEDANRKAVIRTLQAAGLPPLRDNPEAGFTLLPAVGYGAGQDGVMESSLVCDVVVPYSHDTDRKMQKIAEDIRRENHEQSCLLIVRVPCVPETIWKKKSDPSEDQVQTKFQFTSENAQNIRSNTQLGLDGQRPPAKKKAPRRARVGKIVVRIGDWKRLLRGNTGLSLRANSRDLVEFKTAVVLNLTNRATAGG